MGNRSYDERNVRSISHGSNGSYYVTLPLELVKQLGWREKQKVVVTLHGSRLVIEDWKK